MRVSATVAIGLLCSAGAACSYEGPAPPPEPDQEQAVLDEQPAEQRGSRDAEQTNGASPPVAPQQADSGGAVQGVEDGDFGPVPPVTTALEPIHRLEIEGGATMAIFTPEVSNQPDSPGLCATAWSFRSVAATSVFVDDRGVWRPAPPGPAELLVAGEIFEAALAGDGRHLAVATRERVLVVDLERDEAREVVAARAEQVAWSPDGHYLAVRTVPADVFLWDGARAEVVGQGLSFQWLADGRLVARTGLLDPSTGELAPHAFNCCRHLDFAPDGRHAARRTGMNTEIIETKNGSVVATFLDYQLPGWSRDADGMAFAPDGGSLLLIRVDGDICEGTQVTTLAQGKLDGTVTILAQATWIMAPRWSPTGEHVAFRGFHHGLTVTEVGRPGADPLVFPIGPNEMFQWAPDGRSIVYWPLTLGRDLCV